MPVSRCFAVFLLTVFVPSAFAHATEAKIDAKSCEQLRVKRVQLRKSDIFDSVMKGPAWAKANLNPAQLREVEAYIQLDEQLKFGCREAKPSPIAEKASEAAARIEVNSDADPTVPVAADPAKPAASKKKTAAKKPAKSKKSKRDDLKAGSGDPVKPVAVPKPHAEAEPAPPRAAKSKRTPSSTVASGDEPVTLPAFGFGETTVLPHIETSP